MADRPNESDEFGPITRRAAVLAGLGLLAGCVGGGPEGRVGGPVTVGGTNGRRVRTFGILQSDDTVIVTPPGFTHDRPWPAIVFLPMTDASGPESYQHFAKAHATAGNFVAIIPPGVTTRHDYSTGRHFAAVIDRWTERAARAVDRHAGHYSVDRSRIAVAGYSLGGDLAWALSLKAPHSYRGAVIMGSRCSYRQNNSLSVLAARDCRFAFTIGDREIAARAGGQAAARRLLKTRGIAHKLVILHGGHVRPSPHTFLALTTYALG